MQKVLLSIFILFCSAVSAYCWTDIGDGKFIDNIKIDDSAVNFSMKFDSTSSEWQKLPDDVKKNGGYVVINYSIRCSNKTLDADTKVYDNNNNIIEQLPFDNFQHDVIGEFCEKTGN